MRARTKQLMGWIRQTAGSLLGNRRLERQGRIERRSGLARHRFDEATDRAADAIDRSIEASTDAMGPPQNARRTPQQ
jgi:uncharacterized protein YjbJ (UPF0337 family)